MSEYWVWFWRIFVSGVFIYLLGRIVDNLILKNNKD